MGVRMPRRLGVMVFLHHLDVFVELLVSYIINALTEE